MKNINVYITIFAVAIILLMVFIKPSEPQQIKNLGSVNVGNDYLATSTVNDATNIAIKDGAALKLSGGSFARITITTVGTAPLTFYDATTTDITKRAASLATSSLTTIKIPASLAVGTYDFDADLKYGLVVKVGSGTVASSSIMYR